MGMRVTIKVMGEHRANHVIDDAITTFVRDGMYCVNHRENGKIATSRYPVANVAFARETNVD